MKKTITDIEGVYASGVHCGIKSTKKDLSYVFIPNCCASAGVFTKNKFIAPCLIYTREVLERGTAKAVIVNSGNANAVTGETGYKNAAETARSAANFLGLSPDEVCVASTGIIGVQLPMEKIKNGLSLLLDQPKKREGTLAAEAIMTTDTFLKEVYLEREIAGKLVAVSGIAKGSGMIAPNMATMLAYIVTNIKIDNKKLDTVLHEAVDTSFNMISVDNDCSTSDMALIFATGAVDIDLSKKDLAQEFQNLVTDCCVELAKAIARDGEGAERIVEINVEGAASLTDARKVALSVINSPLVKTAIHGADPNWGRVLAAAGKVVEVNLIPDKVDLSFQGVTVFAQGKIVEGGREKLAKELKVKEVFISLNLNVGKFSARAWGCDLTKAYVDINTHYN